MHAAACSVCKTPTMGKKSGKRDDVVKMANPLFDTDPTDPTGELSPRRNQDGKMSRTLSSSSPGKPKKTKDGKAIVMKETGGHKVAYAKDVPEFKPGHGQDARKIYLVVGGSIGACKPAPSPHPRCSSSQLRNPQRAIARRS